QWDALFRGQEDCGCALRGVACCVWRSSLKVPEISAKKKLSCQKEHVTPETVVQSEQAKAWSQEMRRSNSFPGDQCKDIQRHRSASETTRPTLLLITAGVFLQVALFKIVKLPHMNPAML
ncbi:unnamed protein product, partial [Discosporangium mesarthrocarpum]